MLYYMEQNIIDAVEYINLFIEEEENKITKEFVRSSLFLGYSDEYPAPIRIGGLCFFYEPTPDEGYDWIGYVYVSPTLWEENLDVSLWSEGDYPLGYQLYEYEEKGSLN